MSRTIVLHPLIAAAIEYYGAELRVRPEAGISARYSASLAIPRGQIFVEQRAARVADAIQALGEAVAEDHNKRETEDAR